MPCIIAVADGIIITIAVGGGITASPHDVAGGIGLVGAATASCIAPITAVEAGIIIITGDVGGTIASLCADVDGIGFQDAGTTNCTGRTTGAEVGTSSLPAAGLAPIVAVA